MRHVVVGLVAISLAGLAACNPFAPDQTVILRVEDISVTPFITPGSALPVVLFVTTGGCTVFDHISVVRTASAAQLIAMGRNTAKGKPNISCPADIRTDPHTYTLDPPFESPFTIKVVRESLPPLSATVQVQ
jgi:hypothetical protein